MRDLPPPIGRVPDAVASPPDSCAAAEQVAPTEGPRPASEGLPTSGAGRPFRPRTGRDAPAGRGRTGSHRGRALDGAPHGLPGFEDELGLFDGLRNEDDLGLEPAELAAFEDEFDGHARRHTRLRHALSALAAGAAVALALGLHSLVARPVGGAGERAVREAQRTEPHGALQLPGRVSAKARRRASVARQRRRKPGARSSRGEVSVALRLAAAPARQAAPSSANAARATASPAEFGFER